jgi:hypothetical protein
MHITFIIHIPEDGHMVCQNMSVFTVYIKGDQPQLLLTSEDWTHVTISTGLAATTRKDVVACVQLGA